MLMFFFRIKGILNHHSAAGVEVPWYEHFNRVSNLNKLQSKTKLTDETIDLLNKKDYHSDPWDGVLAGLSGKKVNVFVKDGRLLAGAHYILQFVCLGSWLLLRGCFFCTKKKTIFRRKKRSDNFACQADLPLPLSTVLDHYERTVSAWSRFVLTTPW